MASPTELVYICDNPLRFHVSVTALVSLNSRLLLEGGRFGGGAAELEGPADASVCILAGTAARIWLVFDP